MALNANALVTLNLAKGHLAIPLSNTAEDARVELFINAASDRASTYCNRIFVLDDYTESHHGRRQNILLPLQYPINSVAELRIAGDRNWTDAANLIDASKYFIGDGSDSIIYDGIFPNGFGNVRIIYNAGYVTIPSDLQLACLWFVEWFYRHRTSENMGKTSISKGDESIGILAEAPKMILQILDDYKRTEFPASNAPIRNS